MVKIWVFISIGSQIYSGILVFQSIRAMFSLMKSK